MKKLHLTVVLTLTCLLGLGGSARARDNAHSVEISVVVQIGNTKLKTWQLQGGVARSRPCSTGEFPAEREDCGHGARNVGDE